VHFVSVYESETWTQSISRWQKSPKINWLPWQRPLDYCETYGSFLIPIHLTTYAETLTKIGLVVTDIFGWIWWFLLSRPARCSCYPRNLWGYWTECHQFVHNVEKFILFTILKSELWYCSLFRNGNATKEIGRFFSPLGKLAGRAIYFTVRNLARSAKVAERAICFTDRNFYFFLFF